jgi:hypothetical protein
MTKTLTHNARLSLSCEERQMLSFLIVIASWLLVASEVNDLQLFRFGLVVFQSKHSERSVNGRWRTPQQRGVYS